MKKKFALSTILFLIIIVTIFCIIKKNSVFVINSNKVSEVLYVIPHDNGPENIYDITKHLKQEDINVIVNDLNGGKLKPDKTITMDSWKNPNIIINILGDRQFRIYRKSKNTFIVMYPLRPGDNGEDAIKYTKIESRKIEEYFNDFDTFSKGQ